MNTTIQELKEQGYSVKVNHYRFPNNVKMKKFDDSQLYVQYTINGPERRAKGGKTIVEIEKDGKQVHSVAYCSEKDNFNRKLGVKIALNRAMKSFIGIDYVTDNQLALGL